KAAETKAAETKAAAPPSVTPHDGEESLSPSVRRMVEEFGVDPAVIPASGKGGRLLKEDVQRYLETRAPAATAGSTAPAPAAKPVVPRAPRETPRPAPPASGEAVSPKVSPWLHEEDERA